MNFTEIKIYIMTHRPIALYIGRLEMQAMEALANESGFVVSKSPEPDLDRLEYYGVPVYTVNAETHVGYGHKQTTILP